MIIDFTFFSLLVLALFVYFLYLLIFLIGFFLPRKHFSIKTLKASVIVAVRNEEKNIERCINALCTQTYPAELFEVIIVNDQSEDNTEEKIKLMQLKYKNLKSINIKERPENFAPKKYAISEALKIASGEIILTTDADITAEKTWIESIVSFFKDDTGLVAGFSAIRQTQILKWFQKFEALDFLMLMTATKGSINIGIPISCSGQNLSFRRIAFEEVGGFEDQHKTQSADDVLLLHKFRKSKKWKIAFADDPKSYVQTDASKSLIDFLKQRIRWAAMGVVQFSSSIHLTLISLATAIVNISLLFLFVFVFFSYNVIQLFISILLLKFIVDLIIALIGVLFFKKVLWIWFFPVLFLFYAPYILIISIFSLVGNFKWKERVYTKGKFK